MTVEKLWKLISPSQNIQQLAKQTGLSPFQAQLLVNRGVAAESVSSFLNPRLSHLTDPMLLKDMDIAVLYVLKAIENKHKITVYGDYDADGLTATALLVNFFRDLNIPVSCYIPNRLEEGYGLNNAAIEKIAQRGTQLIITVDCGISNENEIRFAKERGVDVVVTDHHKVQKDFKAICPVINPNRADCSFPFKGLSGVGLAFFISVAVRAGLRERGYFENVVEPDLRKYLDLVALGTIADRAPLIDLNRILVDSGIKVIADTRWSGLAALKGVGNVDKSEVTSDDLAFRLAPRLNAPGRIGEADLCIKMLTLDKPDSAKAIALQLDKANRLRQSLERDVFDQITEIIQNQGGVGDRKTLLFSGEGWHQGVLGIVASRLVEKYCRPALVMNVENGLAIGSGRSINGFNLYEALCELSDLFEKFGGHSHAAGFTLKAKNLTKLEKELENLAKDSLSEEYLIASIVVDSEISFRNITHETVNQITALSPFGEGNPEPQFLTRSVEVLSSGVVGERHLKLRLKKGGVIFDSIGFGLSGLHPLQGEIIDLVYTIAINRWQGMEKIQLQIKDLGKTGSHSKLLFEDFGGKFNIFGAEYKKGLLPTG